MAMLSDIQVHGSSRKGLRWDIRQHAQRNKDDTSQNMLLIFIFYGSLTFTLAYPPNPWWKLPTYSDELARSKMLPLAAAAYSNWPQMCLENRFTNAVLSEAQSKCNVYLKLKRQVNVSCGPLDDNDVCFGFTAVLHDNKTIVISFRGTTTFLQLVAEADLSVFYDKVPWIAGGWVSRYFFDGFMGLWYTGMGDDFAALREQYPEYEIWVTGHSLGAALASLASSYIIATNQVSPMSLRLVTFGQPRVGDVFYSWVHDRQMSYSFRVTHWRDVVPHVPPEMFELYYHHMSEAFYPLEMTIGTNYTVCYANESKKCSDGLFDPTSIKDHLHYFGVDVSEYGEYGCNKTMDAIAQN
ncbi:triacylglycerol lipase [Teladorsagia circumcincta]|uniref:Triacylglycerol lipase n=1 Tax=Teladorsagia circumcincta TaxID=45464 RepID=A0A2G9UZ37_TELCI|nr:triacylglycerol lipase [Teladorsagia circumcincta]